MRNTYTRYHICLMRVFILLLSIRYNMCVYHNPVYHYITATVVYLVPHTTFRQVSYVLDACVDHIAVYPVQCVCLLWSSMLLYHRYCCLPHTTFTATCVDDISRMNSHCMYCCMYCKSTSTRWKSGFRCNTRQTSCLLGIFALHVYVSYLGTSLCWCRLL